MRLYPQGKGSRSRLEMQQVTVLTPQCSLKGVSFFHTTFNNQFSFCVILGLTHVTKASLCTLSPEKNAWHNWNLHRYRFRIIFRKTLHIVSPIVCSFWELLLLVAASHASASISDVTRWKVNIANDLQLWAKCGLLNANGSSSV